MDFESIGSLYQSTVMVDQGRIGDRSTVILGLIGKT